MTVNISASGVIHLKGICGVEDAEELLQLLLTTPEASIDWDGCESVHAAVMQVLLVAKVMPVGSTASSFLQHVLTPILKTQSA